MSFSKIYTRGLLGLHAPLIEVEVHVSQGLPSLTIVGLAEAAVRESKDRVLRCRDSKDIRHYRQAC